MPSNREISKLFTLYAELLLLNNEDERGAIFSGAAYGLRNIAERVASLTKEAVSNKLSNITSICTTSSGKFLDRIF